MSKERHFIVVGRIPGDDEDNIAHVEVPAGSKRDAWQTFVEDVLYSGVFWPAEDYCHFYKENGRYPEGALPDDWQDRQPTDAESIYGTWAYHCATFEIQGPPISTEFGDG